MVSEDENFTTISTLAVVETLAIEDLNSTKIFSDRTKPFVVAATLFTVCLHQFLHSMSLEIWLLAGNLNGQISLV